MWAFWINQWSTRIVSISLNICVVINESFFRLQIDVLDLIFSNTYTYIYNYFIILHFQCSTYSSWYILWWYATKSVIISGVAGRWCFNGTNLLLSQNKYTRMAHALHSERIGVRGIVIISTLLCWGTESRWRYIVRYNTTALCIKCRAQWKAANAFNTVRAGRKCDKCEWAGKYKTRL